VISKIKKNNYILKIGQRCPFLYLGGNKGEDLEMFL
jgi:hypothetical protein